MLSEVVTAATSPGLGCTRWWCCVSKVVVCDGAGCVLCEWSVIFFIFWLYVFGVCLGFVVVILSCAIGNLQVMWLNSVCCVGVVVGWGFVYGCRVLEVETAWPSG